MNNKYRKTITTVSLINYHFVFCPRYRRKIFDNPKVEKRFKELMIEISSNLDLKILVIECHRDHTHIFFKAPPKLSPS